MSFILSSGNADSFILIFFKRNAGILGGKFMERTRVLRPGSSLTDAQGPLYYTPADLYVGGQIEVLSHHFVLLDADDYVFHYMESDPSQFRQSNIQLVVGKLSQVLNEKPELKGTLAQVLSKAAKNPAGQIERKVVVDLCRPSLGRFLTDHVILYFIFSFEVEGRIFWK